MINKLKADMTITQMVDGTYTAWKKVRLRETREFDGIIEANAKTILEAEQLLREKLSARAKDIIHQRREVMSHKLQLAK